MTIQHTHHENSDVDTPVVEHPSAPSTAADPTPFETVTPAETPGDTDTPSVEPATATEQETHPEAAVLPTSAEADASVPSLLSLTPEQEASIDQTATPTVIGTGNAPTPVEARSQAEHPSDSALTGTQETHSDAPTTHVSSTTTSNEDTNNQVASAGTAAEVETPAYAQETTILEDKAEEVRPFTDFIAEFRQAEEAARLQATLNESQTETFSLLTQTEFAAEASSVHLDQAETGTTSVSGTASQEGSVTAPGDTAAETPAEIVRPTPPERAVSPLLRPATRIRVPRHGVRHQREEAAAETPVQTPTPDTQTVTTPSETPAAAEPTRPTRRYRFDRPAAAAHSKTPATPASTTPATAPAPAQTRAESARAEAAQPATEQNAAPAAEPQQTRKHAAQESASESTAAPSAPENGRRRHNNKESAAAAANQAASTPPVVEVPVAQPEPAPKAEEVAPEDLPPLEYSELQKASSRRRRRHRSNASPVTPVAASAPIVPSIPAVVPPVSAPIVPAAPAPSPSQSNGTTYTIVSGYTVNQMNQGNDITGPFMGPEPSPARGSLFTRDGRGGRLETQRAAHSASSYPVRTSESGLSAASMTQFANIVSQAIQTQTDRMVTELRRANQAPTNVSVSLPPFPSTERVGVFVDVANLLYSARTLRIAVDFGKLLDFLRGNRRLVRAQAYCPTSPQAGDEQMFLQAVKGLGYRITTKNYKTFSSGAKKADLDLDLCMDVVRLVDGRSVDCIVLVSGDSDFMPMLDYCSDHGVRVEVAAFDEAMSATLRQSCDLFINLSMLEEIRA